MTVSNVPPGLTRPSTWDFRLSAGPPVRGYVTLGIAWRWVPHVSLRLRPSVPLMGLAAACVIAVLWSLIGAVAALAVLAAWSVGETRSLRRRVTASLERTTAGAAALTSTPESPVLSRHVDRIAASDWRLWPPPP
jgi:hypothetical protein